MIEVTVALGLAAFAFAALAAAMAGGLRALSVEKTRARANEVATQAIEDLQRLSYDGLGVCAAASSTPPSGLTSIVTLPNCPATPVNTYGQQPCDATTAGLTIPASRYICTRLGRTYTVTRYVVWGDAEHTIKRLAVFVDWRDTVGDHQVTQQSSIRSPSVASIIGLAPPTLSSPSVNPGTVLTVGGAPENDVNVQVNVSGLSATDRVVATFTSLSGTEAVNSSISLALDSGTLWKGTITNAFTFGAGSQFLTIAGVRTSDGKANSVTTSVVKFCPKDIDPSCGTSTLPKFVGAPAVPSNVAITGAGGLTQNVSVSVVTQNVTPTDSVSFSFQTLAGSVTVFMQPNSALSCTEASCTWQGTIPTSAGYAFPGGGQTFYFLAAQDVNPDPSSVDKGSTVATSSGTVTFS